MESDSASENPLVNGVQVILDPFLNATILLSENGFYTTALRKEGLIEGDALTQMRLSGVRALDVGHGKDLKFAYYLAQFLMREGVQNSRVDYYDSSDDSVFAKLKRSLFGNGDGSGKTREIPENLNFTRAPEGPYDYASFVFTLHDAYHEGGLFSKDKEPRQSLEKVCEFLKPGGKLFVIDYDLDWIPKLPFSEEEKKTEFVKWFNADNERKILDATGDVYESDCYETHTRYGRKQCEEDGTALGLESIYWDSKPEGTHSKLFLGVLRKPDH